LLDAVDMRTLSAGERVAMVTRLLRAMPRQERQMVYDLLQDIDDDADDATWVDHRY